MTTLVVHRVLSTCPALAPSPGIAAVSPGDDLVLDAAASSGGFGTVSGCVAVAGRPVTGVVAKVHHDAPGMAALDGAAVLVALHRAIDAAAATGAGVAARLPAVPFWVGEARRGADIVVVSLAVDLVAAGYGPLAPVLDDVRLLSAHLSTPVAERVALAASFADAHAACEEIGLLHADVNAENAFIDLARRRATLIDFDSGWVPGSPHPGPLAWGKPDDFIAPEMKAGGTLRAGLISPLTERWAVGCLLHYLIFGVGPLFFLSTLSDTSIAAYLAAHTWPDIDQHSPLFNHPNRAFYSRYLQELADLPPSAVDLFRRFVADGALHPGDRPTSAEWLTALDALAAPPVFTLVAVSATATVDARPVRVSWVAAGASEVVVAGRTHAGDRGTATVPLAATGRIQLAARNPFGVALAETDEVAVYRVPAPVVVPPPAPVVGVPSVVLLAPRHGPAFPNAPRGPRFPHRGSPDAGSRAGTSPGAFAARWSRDGRARRPERHPTVAPTVAGGRPVGPPRLAALRRRPAHRVRPSSNA